MACYHPNLLIPTGGYTESGKPDYRFIKNQEIDNDKLVNHSAYGYKLIPCGKCLGCRLDYARSWADRMSLEMETSKKAIFITLTYNNQHIPYQISTLDDGSEIPIGFTFDKRDVQLFMKNLRKAYDGKDGRPFAKIRFFLAAERGERTHRPHYHAIIFGLGIDDFPDRVPKGMNELGQQYYIIPSLERCWHEFDKKKRDLGSRGFVLASDVSYATFGYVARYTLKKAVPVGDEFEFEDLDREFNLMSRRPGIGCQYLSDHPECLYFTTISVASKEGSKTMSIPRYFLRKTELTDPLLVAKIKKDREKCADDTFFNSVIHTSLSYLDQLELEEEQKLRSISAIARRKKDI